MVSLRVPFDEEHTCFLDGLILPATYHRRTYSSTSSHEVRRVATDFSRVGDDLGAFFAYDLNLARLNIIHNHLWLAGLERPARPLHQQIAIGRAIIVTESADLHLLWKGNRIYIKPLPEYLLSHAEWEKTIISDRDLHELATGFLLSYLWLICHRSDLSVAHQHGLVPKTVDWQRWTNLARSASRHLDIVNLGGINVRFRHGELRLNRVDWIYRLSSATRNTVTFLRGFRPGHYQLDSFVQSKLTSVATAFAYIVLVLTALQVGLATDPLRENAVFQDVSYGFTVFSILAPIVIVVFLMISILVALLFNANYAFAHRKKWDEVSVPGPGRSPNGGILDRGNLNH
jgi:hypothetical protein